MSAAQQQQSGQQLSAAQTLRASEALLQHCRRVQPEAEGGASKKSELFPQDSGFLPDAEPVQLVAALRRVPEGIRVKPQRLSVPHDLWGAESEVCLIVKDPQRTYKDLLEQANARAEKARAAEAAQSGKGRRRRQQQVDSSSEDDDESSSGSSSDSDGEQDVADSRHIPVTLVVGLQKLRDNYKTFEAKRRLSSGFDLFLVDDRILPLVPKLLGKSFFQKKKQPVAVSISRVSSWERSVRNAIYGATYMHQNAGACTNIRAGHTAMTPQQLAENVVAAANGFAANIPRKWKNIHSLHIKTTDSIALPIFNSTIDTEVTAEADAVTTPAQASESPATKTTGKGRKKEGSEKRDRTDSKQKKRDRTDTKPKKRDRTDSKQKSSKRSPKNRRTA